jgi:hypothetical protein
MKSVHLAQGRVQFEAVMKTMRFTFHKGGQTERLSIVRGNCVTANSLPVWSLSVQTMFLKQNLAFLLRIQEVPIRALFLKVSIKGDYTFLSSS